MSLTYRIQMLFEIYLMCAKKLDNGLFTLEKHFLDHQLSFQDQITLRLLFKMGATLFTFLALTCVSKIEFVKKMIQNGHFSPPAVVRPIYTRLYTFTVTSRMIKSEIQVPITEIIYVVGQL